MSNSANGEEKNIIVGGTLYLVATPIGNLSDISERALKVLSGVDRIAAEDTRNTQKMLMRYGISVPLVSYYEHNKVQRGEQIIKGLENGEKWALVTDAGTPAISDPGEDIVRLCALKNIPVTMIPGPCAAIDALALSALSARRFVFEGFFEGSKTKQKEYYEELKHEKRTIVFYESPHDLRDTLDIMFTVFGDRRVALCRELTKLNEEIMRTNLTAAVEYYKVNEPRGEYVIVLEGCTDDGENDFWKEMSIGEHVGHYEALGLSKMDAIKQTARDRGVGKSVIYKQLL